MHRITSLRSSLFTLTAAIALIALVSVFACTPDTADETVECPELESLPDSGDTPLGPPPGMPYIFAGTAYVDGEPAPEGELLYVKLTASRSHDVEILADGKYRDIIHGPVHPSDSGVPFVFCLGDPDGQAVMSEETAEYEDKGTFHEVELDLHFPMLASDLGSR